MSCDNECEPFETCVEQDGSFEYSATLKKKDGSAVTLAELDDITLTLTNQANGEVINNRDDVSVKNANGGTFHATTGAFTFDFAPADNPITEDGADSRREKHVAMFTATWGSGAYGKRWGVIITVDNLDKLAGVTTS